LRLGMRRPLQLCLIGAAISVIATLHLTRAINLDGDDAVSTAITRNASHPSPEMATLRDMQDEVHSVVVEMPQVISLAYADPETWGTLPTWTEPDDQPPSTPVLQVATTD
jgi:hypothetical protein